MATSFSLPAQDFLDLISKGDSLYDSEDYQASAEHYEEALKLGEGLAAHYYNAACSWALAGQSEPAIKNLLMAAEKGWTNLNHMRRDGDLESLRNLEEWAEVEEAVLAAKAKSEEGLNIELKERLEHIYLKDQVLRQLYREAEDKFGNGTDEMNYFWSVIAEKDEECLEEVIEILEEHGWVGKSEVGGQANAALWLVILHADLEIQNKYLPLLEESVAKGESRGQDLALLQDRILMRMGEPQIYGSQTRMDPETNEWVVHEISAPEYVNQRRASIGLGPIEDYLERRGIEWKVEQKER